MIKRRFLFTILTFCCVSSYAQNFVTTRKEPGAFSIVSPGQVTSICVDDQDNWLVQKAALLLQAVIEMTTGKKPALVADLSLAGKNCIIIGSLPSASIQQLVKTKKIDAKNIDGWESFSLQTVSNPVKGIEHALVITGSDKRGVAYGVFELSKQLGVSPWYWWADVPVKKKTTAYVKKACISMVPLP